MAEVWLAFAEWSSNALACAEAPEREEAGWAIAMPMSSGWLFHLTPKAATSDCHSLAGLACIRYSLGIAKACIRS